MLNYNDIVGIFEEIEIKLILSLKKNLLRHKQEEHKYGFDWSAWQAEKIRDINKFRHKNLYIMNNYTSNIDSATRKIMLDEFSQGMNGVKVPETDEPHFFGIDDTKIDKLIDNVVTLEKHAETAVLRTMDDIYRQTVNKAQLAMNTGSVTLQQAIDMSVQDFLNKGIDCIIYRNGRRVNIADYVRMALRTTATRANLYGISAKIRQLGYDTVLVSNYGMCSDTCLPWQGRPYIDDVFSLWDGEIQERSGGELWGKSHYCGKWFPLLSTALHGGLFHPNCRHTITMWRDGDPIPEPQDNSGIQQRYKLEQHQRQLENKVRRAKRFVAGQSDPENVKKSKKRLREAQKELREFIADTNLNEGGTVLKRDYGKEKIYTVNSLNNLTSTSDSDTIVIASNAHPRDIELEKTIKRCIKQDKPVFADDLAKVFPMIRPEKDRYIMSLHGTPNETYIYDKKIDARTLANIIRSRKDYNNEEIVLISCNTGNTEHTKVCFAQKFANEMGVTVHAPTKYGIINIFGQYYSGTRKGKREGEFKPFKPEKKE